MSGHQIAGRNHNIKIANRTFEDVVKFRYFGMTITSRSLIHEEIKSRLNSGNGWCHSVKKLMSSGMLSKNLKFKIHSYNFACSILQV
jgi:hypothetical protein